MAARIRDFRLARHAGLEYAVAIEDCRSAGQDRAAVLHNEDGIIVALADGAGGTANGAQAAEAVINAVENTRAVEPAALLYELDDPERVGYGETTAVIVSVHGETLDGASVGDSGAWIINPEGVIDLTRDQLRKPLVGAGCTPVVFSNAFNFGSTLLVASDGLLRYAKPSEIVRVAQHASIEEAIRALIDVVRLRSGELQDDISIVLVRHAP